MSAVDIPNQFSLDVNGLTALKRQVRENSPGAIKAASQQFEALFLQMVLKSMREATPQDGMFDSDQSRMYQSLMDQQLAQVLTAKGGGTGLAALIEKQLSRPGVDPQSLDTLPNGLPFNPPPRAYGLPGNPPPIPLPQGGIGNISPPSADAVPPAAREFVNRVWTHAYEASKATGIPAHFMVAQAALETGWGKSEPRFADGRPSYNLFGVKAGKNWNGAVVEANATEYVNGVAQKQVEHFRAYASYAESFRDYANLLNSSPRYAGVVGSRDASVFARGLQQAGYATDPMYAAKLERIISGNTLRQSLSS
ncbi:MAG: flagellar assembly peptidoglycan hydrolase FlgJ [Betaproteobacteria bacterium]|nr:flagellar assembly peptidoglycan hydrolase FlgJ [Betaproteobacteria bacterium]